MTYSLFVRDAQPHSSVGIPQMGPDDRRGEQRAIRLMNHSGSAFEGLRLSQRQVVLILALKESRVRVYKNGQIAFNGAMVPGTAKVFRPSNALVADVHSPGDVLIVPFDPDEVADILGQTCGSRASYRCQDDFTVRGEPIRQQGHRFLAALAEERLEYARDLLSAAFDAARNAPRVRSLPSWRLQRVERHVQSRLSGPIALNELAAVAGLSKMHFAAAFRAATSYSPHEYIVKLRIEAAKELLADRGSKIVDVAFAVGYQSQAHFSTVFKKSSGYTPAQWRLLSRGAPHEARPSIQGRAHTESGAAWSAGGPT